VESDTSQPALTLPLIHPLLRLDVIDLVSERVGVDRAVIDLARAALTAPAVEPGDAVLHPVLVVTLGEILMHVRAAAFLAVGGAVHGDHGLRNEVVELERLDEGA